MYTENTTNYNDNYDEYEENNNSSNNKVSLIIKILIIVVCLIILIWLIVALKKNDNSDVSYDANAHVNNVQKVRLAAEKYFFINDNMPEKDKVMTVTLSKLISNGLTDEVIDANKKVCNDLNTVATLSEEDNAYALHVKLACSTEDKEEIFYYNKNNYACLNCNGVTNMDGKTNPKNDDKKDEQEDSNNESSNSEYSCTEWSNWSSVRITDSKLKERTRTVVLGVKEGETKEEITYSDWSEYTKTPIKASDDLEVETKTISEGVWSEIKTSSSYIQDSDKIKVVSTNSVNGGSYSYCPKGYQKDGNKCYSESKERGDLTYKEYNSGNYIIYNKPCDRLNTELDADGKYSLVYKNCLFTRVTDLKTGYGSSYTVYNYQELVDTMVTYYRYRTKTVSIVKENDKYTNEYYEEDKLPADYKKVDGSEKTEYSYMLSMCEK